MDNATPPKIETNEVQSRLDLHQMLGFVRRRWKFIVSITALALVIGVTMLMQVTPLYTATTEILLDQEREKAAGAEAFLTTAYPNAAMIDDEMAVLRSTVLLRRVVERQHLVADRKPAGREGSQPADASPSTFAWIRSLLPWFPAHGAESPSQAPSTPSDEETAAVEALKGSVAVSRPARLGFVVGISVTSPDPERAARLANAIADAYLVDKLDTRFDAAKRASAWLNDRIGELRKQLHDSEEAVTQFRTEHNLFQNGNITLSQQQLSELNAKLVDARADAAQKKARVDLLNSLQAKGGLGNMPDFGLGTNLPTLRQQAAALSQQAADLVAKYGEPHPLVVNIHAQQRDVERSVASETQRLAATIRNDYALAQSKVGSLEKSLREASGQTGIDDATAIRLRELERTAAVNKTLFEDFLQRAKITQAQATFEPHDVRIITPARPPGAPSYPQKSRYLSVTLLIGLFLGVSGAVAKERLDTSFTTTKQIEDILSLPVLAWVNRLTNRDLRVDGATIPVQDYPGIKPLSRFAESIRSLRSGIHMTDVDRPPKVIQFTSAVPREGKTTIAMSVARSGAISNLKVLYIDADLRHPTASRILDLQKSPGLVDLLLGETSADDALRFQEQAGYWMLSSGSNTQAPTDLLSSERMKTLVTSLRDKFDLILIDTPPTGPVIDPVIVSHLADKVVLVVRWAATARDLVKQSTQQLAGHKKIAGVALNLVNDRQVHRYEKGGYSYYKNYKHYYID